MFASEVTTSWHYINLFIIIIIIIKIQPCVTAVSVADFQQFIHCPQNPFLFAVAETTLQLGHARATVDVRICKLRSLPGVPGDNFTLASYSSLS